MLSHTIDCLSVQAVSRSVHLHYSPLFIRPRRNVQAARACHTQLPPLCFLRRLATQGLYLHITKTVRGEKQTRFCMQVESSRLLLLLLLLLLVQTLCCTATPADQVPSMPTSDTSRNSSVAPWPGCISHVFYGASGQFQLAPALLGRRICFYFWRDHTAEGRNRGRSSLHSPVARLRLATTPKST